MLVPCSPAGLRGATGLRVLQKWILETKGHRVKKGVCENSASVIISGLGSLPVIMMVGASSNPLGFLDLDELFVLSFSGKAESWSLGSMSGLELSGSEGVLGGS